MPSMPVWRGGNSSDSLLAEVGGFEEGIDLGVGADLVPDDRGVTELGDLCPVLLKLLCGGAVGSWVSAVWGVRDPGVVRRSRGDL